MPPWNWPDAGRGERHVESLVARLVALETLGHVAQLADHARRHLDRVDRVRRQRGMRLLAAHAAAVAVHALVRDGRHHAGRLADDAGQRPDPRVAQVGDQLAHAEAADLLLVAEGQVHGKGRVAVQERLRIGDGQRDEALHVGRTPAEQLAVAHHRLQRVGAPVLAVPRHRVGVAGQDHTGRLAFAQRGEQVGLGPVRVEGQPAGDAQPGQLVTEEVDQFQVGVGADGVHPHQRAGELEGAGRRRGRDGHRSHFRGYRRQPGRPGRPTLD